MNRKRPKKRKRELSQEKLMELWAVKRTGNVYRMIKEMAKDDGRLFEVASKVLLDLSDTPWKMGDEVGSILLGWMGSRFSSLRSELKRAKKRKYKIDIEKWNDRRANE